MANQSSKFDIRIGFGGILTENIRLDSKTLLADNAQLWQYRLWSFKSGDTQSVRIESKLYSRVLKNLIRIRIGFQIIETQNISTKIVIWDF